QGGARRRSPAAPVTLLAGVTVLSLEQATTLPFLTYRLACDGARVIRIENTERPDPNRFVGKDVLAEPAMRSYFLSNNCGKEAITLNLGHPEGQALLRELIAKLRVDVFACNQRPRSYARLGIEPPALSAVKPDLIWLGITGFGPEHDEAAYDPVLQARSGFMELTGKGNRHQFFAPVAVHRTRDGHVYLAIGNDQQWAALTALPRFGALARPEYAANAGRIAEVERLDRELAGCFAELTSAEALDSLRRAGVPGSRVNTVPDVMTERLVAARLVPVTDPR